MPERIPRPSRRAVLAAAAGSAALTVTRALQGPLPVSAAGDDGTAVQIGTTYADVQSQTTLGNRANDNRVLWVASNPDLGNGNGVAVTGFSAKNVGVEGWSTSGIGVYGHSDNAIGVQGETGAVGAFAVRARHTAAVGSAVSLQAESLSSGGTGLRAIANGQFGTGVSASGGSSGVFAYGGSAGVIGRVLTDSGQTIGVHGDAFSPSGIGVRGVTVNSTGVLGFSSPGGGPEPTAKPRTGVYGHAVQDGSSRGVWGRSNAGRGVYGQATGGVGVYAQAGVNGIAMRANGRVKVDKVSGVATIKAGSTGVTLTPGVKVTSASFVLLTPKVNLGGRDLWFTTNSTAGTLTIRMSSARTSGTKVAWLLLG